MFILSISCFGLPIGLSSVFIQHGGTLRTYFHMYVSIGTCTEAEIACDGVCISDSLVCDGYKNCPGGADEKECPGGTGKVEYICSKL